MREMKFLDKIFGFFLYYKFEILILALILGLNWLAYFSGIRQFGFYEDDYVVVVPPLGYSFKDLCDQIIGYLSRWSQGRPLGYILPSVFTFFGNKLGGLVGIYLIGYFIIVLNSFLFFLLLKRIGPKSNLFVLVGTIVFILFPADTTKTLLTHSLILQPSLSFLLLALLLYLSNRKLLSYMVISAALLTYESAFITFLAVPFLKNFNFSKKNIMAFIKHASILGFLILIAIIVRKFMGESRVSELSDRPFRLIYWILSSLIIGPVTIFKLFLRAPAVTLLQGNVFPIVLTSSIFFYFLFKYYLYFVKDRISSIFKIKTNDFSFLLSIKWSKISPFLLHLIGSSLILLSFSYLFAFTHYPPTAPFGRSTSVHLCASIGASLFFASIILLIFNFLQYYKLEKLFYYCLCLYFGFLFGYQYLVQKDFVKSWKYQRMFWPSIITLTPDITENTLILVDKSALPKTKYIETNSWVDPIILEMMFSFPKEWKYPPQLFVVDWKKWKDDLKIDDNNNVAYWQVPMATWWPYEVAIPNENVILLKMQNGKLERLITPVNIRGYILNLKTNESIQTVPYPKKLLYDYLIEK